MRADVTAEEVAAYRDSGFVVVPGLLTQEELRVWRDAVDEAVARRDCAFAGPAVGRGPTDEGGRDAAAYYAKVFTQRVNLWQTSERVRELILDPRLARLAATLAGVRALRLWHDQALIKEPYANPTAFHLDVPYWSFSSHDAISVWVALDDATLQNGCLYYLPGSHRAATFDNVGIGSTIDALFDVYPDWRDVEPVACPVAAGSAIFHNGLTMHGAGANMTSRQRRAMTAGFMPDGSKFNGIANILPASQLATLRPGDVLADDAHNPLVYVDS